ncbi:39S ribosomal protein L44, mitochondrial [Orussus abietinus]|uniref:39S ribosomal protein L44, mitochondrial n=1 Tax=Orussus abietinus TaxID=222816 RepID=UPI0006257E7C|nr:39S ribosomal protein L44, mitochondrial [Orussus abietinus]
MNALRNCIKGTISFRSLNLLSYSGQRSIKRWVAPTLKELRRRQEKLGPQPEPVRSSFLEWNRSAELYAFNKRLTESFKTDLLEQSFTHRSYIIQEEQKQKELGIEIPQLDIKSNDELIQEGREITSRVVKSYLRQSLPCAPEECIRSLHDYLLSTAVLAKVSSHIGTKDLILSAEHPIAIDTLATTFFALVSALTRSTDVVHAGVFVRDFLIALLAEKDLTEIWCPNNPLEILNSILARENRQPAEPRLVGQAAATTLLATYRIALYSNKQFLSIGFGESIEVAKEIAALDALFRLFKLNRGDQPIKTNLKINICEEEIQNLPLAQWCSVDIAKHVPTLESNM